MGIREIADKVMEASRNGTVKELLDSHYAADAVSVEAFAMDPERGRAAEGLEAIRAKHAWWDETMTVHSASAEGPFLHGDDRFAVIFNADATDNASGRRNEMREVAVYHVKDDKIVREEFFYTF